MDAIDKHYFDSLQPNVRPSYDWITHTITPGCAVADVSLDKVDVELTTEGQLCFSKLIHEYIHFLQNFCTIWGTPVFTDLALALMKIGASSLDERGPFQRPLRPSQISPGLMKDGFDLLATVHERIGRHSEVYTDKDKPPQALSIDFIDDNNAELSNGRLRMELGHKVIREHMAHLGTMLLLGRTDELIHKHHKEDLSRKDGESWVQQSEYWCLFEYFFALNLYKDVAKGTFLLMQACMTRMNPHWALTRFLKWQSPRVFHSGATSLCDDVAYWMMAETEQKYSIVAITKTMEHLDNALRSARLSANTNDLGSAAQKIVEYAMSNLKFTNAGHALFGEGDAFDRHLYWKGKIRQFGTGFIQYTDAVQISGTPAHIGCMDFPFQVLASCHSIIKMIQEAGRQRCPFMEDYSICKWEERNQHCQRDPFQMNTMDPDGGSCLFRNGVLLLGLNGRVENVAV